MRGMWQGRLSREQAVSYEEKRKEGKGLQGESEQLYQKLLSQMRTKPFGHVEVTADL